MYADCLSSSLAWKQEADQDTDGDVNVNQLDICHTPVGLHEFKGLFEHCNVPRWPVACVPVPMSCVCDRQGVQKTYEEHEPGISPTSSQLVDHVTSGIQVPLQAMPC